MTNKTKQTAFQWYMEQHNILVKSSDYISIEERFKRITDIVKQAKEMEKEQIMQSLNDGKSMVLGTMENTSLEQYYKQTYGSKKL